MNIFKKLKEKGFTLIELIATIALLAVIALISFVSVNAVIKNNKSKQWHNLVNGIKIAAKQYASENKGNYTEAFSSENGTIEVSLTDLTSKGYLTAPIIDPYTNREIENFGSIIIILHLENGTVKEVSFSGMPDHGDDLNDSNIVPQGEIVDNDGNGNNNSGDNNTGNNNSDNNGGNTAQTYRLTLSCHSDLNPQVNYNNCWIDGDNTKVLEVQANTTINLDGMICSCYQGVSHVGWADTETMALHEFGNFTMPEKDITLYALYETE